MSREEQTHASYQTLLGAWHRGRRVKSNRHDRHCGGTQTSTQSVLVWDRRQRAVVPVVAPVGLAVVLAEVIVVGVATVLPVALLIVVVPSTSLSMGAVRASKWCCHV